MGRFVGIYYPAENMSVGKSVMKGCAVGARRKWKLGAIVGRSRRRCFVLQRMKKRSANRGVKGNGLVLSIAAKGVVGCSIAGFIPVRRNVIRK